MWDLPPPAFPGARQDRHGKGRGGSGLFARYCADCHGSGRAGGLRLRYAPLSRGLARSSRSPRSAPIRGAGPPTRQNFAAAQNLLYAGYPWRFHRFHKTEGYANHPLDGIWARSPYLHNGSVPTLRDLLEPSARRPGGLVSRQRRTRPRSRSATAPTRRHPAGRSSATTPPRPGNANTGHEGRPYGTDLPASAKDALVEYMKTL